MPTRAFKNREKTKKPSRIDEWKDNAYKSALVQKNKELTEHKQAHESLTLDHDMTKKELQIAKRELNMYKAREQKLKKRKQTNASTKNSKK